MTVTYLDRLLLDVNGRHAFRQFFMAAPNKEEILRALAQESMDAFKKRFTRTETNVIPVQTFDVVGATEFDLQKGGNIDSIRFYDMFMYILKTGIPIRPDFSVHVSNLINDEDYLQTKTQADVTLISYVPLMDDPQDTSLDYIDINRPSTGFLRAKDAVTHARQQGMHTKDIYTVASVANQMVSYLNTPENWTKRLLASGSKLIFSIYNGQEVNLGRVMPEGYSSLGKLDKYDAFRDVTRITDVVPFGSMNWQVIGANTYIEAACYVALPDVDIDTGLPLRGAKQIGTQMGTGIQKMVRHLFDLEMKRLDALEAKRPVKDTPKMSDPKGPAGGDEPL